MRGQHTLQREIAVGHRIVSVSRLAYGLNKTRTLEGPSVERVVEVDEDARRLGHAMRLVLEGPEGRREVHMAHTGFRRDPRREILWSDPLPEDDAQAIALVAAAFLRDSGYASLLFWAGPSHDGVSYCHLVTDVVHAEEAMVATDGMFYSPHGIPMRLPDGVAAGTLIGVDRLRAEMVDGRCIHTPANVVTVMTGVTLAEACAIPVVERRRSDFPVGNFGSMHEVMEAEELAYARNEPSEALVVSWMDGDSRQVHVLGSSGIAFHHQDDIACYVEGHIVGDGLWLIANAEMHGYHDHEGGYDQDLDADAVPADHDAIRRLFGPVAEIAREMVDVIGDPVEADDLIAQAVKADEEDRAATEAARIARAEAAEKATA